LAHSAGVKRRIRPPICAVGRDAARLAAVMTEGISLLSKADAVVRRAVAEAPAMTTKSRTEVFV